MSDAMQRAQCRQCGGPIGEPDGITGVGNWVHGTEAACIEYLKTSLAAQVAQHEAARVEIEAVIGHTYGKGVSDQVLAILARTAPRADAGVVEGVLELAVWHSSHAIHSPTNSESQRRYDATAKALREFYLLHKGVAAVRDGIVSFIEERRERGYNNWANGAEACVRILDQRFPAQPAAQSDGPKHIVAPPFERQIRYAVIKLKDVPEDMLPDLRDFLGRADLPHRECLVIESDWPEYEVAWRMIEDRVSREAARPADGADGVAAK